MESKCARILITTLLIFIIMGCASQPQRITQTANPEVLIPNVELETVRTKIIERMLSGGLRLDQETPSRLVFSKQMEGIEEAVTRVALGNSYSTPVGQTLPIHLLN